MTREQLYSRHAVGHPLGPCKQSLGIAVFLHAPRDWANLTPSQKPYNSLGNQHFGPAGLRRSRGGGRRSLRLRLDPTRPPLKNVGNPCVFEQSALGSHWRPLLPASGPYTFLENLTLSQKPRNSMVKSTFPRGFRGCCTVHAPLGSAAAPRRRILDFPRKP